MDGICDDIDTCDGVVDALGECGGTCESDNNANGTCDDAETTVWDVISSNDSLLNTLDAAIVVAGLDSALSILDTSTAYTVFAPTDTAFAVLLAELGLGAEDLLADTTGLLVNTLLYHVLGGVVMSADLMDGDSYATLQGDSVLVSVMTDSTGTTVMVNDATVIVADVMAANGVVHIIDVVLTPPVFGCMDEMACNYNADATDDDGSCTYPEEDYLDCDGNCLNDADGDEVCDELEVEGCTNVDACNYDALATDDDGSCILVGDTCDDGDENTINDTLDENCVCVGDVEDGVEEVQWEWTLHPSPATDVLRLTLSSARGPDGLTMEVMTSTGRIVETHLLYGSTSLDVSAYPSGVYIVTLTNAWAERSSKRFVVTK